MSDSKQTVPTVLYDGLCGLCGITVSFLARRTTPSQLRLLPLQSDEAAAILGRAPAMESLLYVSNGEVTSRSSAALKALAVVGGGWWLLARVLLAVPRPVRDAVYRTVAQNRYKIFGKHDSCYIVGDGQRRG